MLETVVSLISNLVQLGLKLYSERTDKHEQIVQAWKDLQDKAAGLDSALQQYRNDRDAATLKKLDELSNKHVAVKAVPDAGDGSL